MKITTLPVFILFSLVFSSFAQTNIAIGTGTSMSQHLPIEPYYGYTYSQSIYLAEEVGMAGTIRQISYYYNGNSDLSSSANWTIFIGHTSKLSFSSSTNWVDISTLTEVFSGDISASASAGWITIDISDFEYNGTDNLIIAVDENQSGYDNSSDEFYCSSVSGSRSIYFYNDSTNPDPSGPPTSGSYLGTISYIPNIQLDMLPVPVYSGDDFESGEINPDYVLGGNSNWIISSSSPYAGNYCLESGDIGDNESSTVEIEVSGAESISFYRYVSSESGYDYLHFYIDEVEQAKWAGNPVNWAQVSYDLPDTGTHTLKWSYIKDGSASYGLDCARIDNLELTPANAQMEYTVTFEAGDYGAITAGDAIQSIAEGGDALPPTITAATGYVFIGWDGSYNNISNNTTLIAQYVGGSGYAESFETGMGIWSDSTGFDFSWTRKSGTTASSSTGPSGASDGSYYIYTEASSPNYPSKTAGIEADFNFSGMSAPALLFDFHMYGSTMGALYVDIYDGTWHSGVWSMSGQQQTSEADAWISSGVDLSDYAGESITIRFRGIIGSNFYSDMCVDNVSIANDVTFNHTVTFEAGDHGSITAGDDEQSIEHGADAIPPTVTPDTGYNFTGWDGPYSNITHDVTLTAQYELITYTVTFEAGSNGVISGGDAVQVVGHGNAAFEPTVTPVEGFVLTGWDSDFSIIISNMTVTAQYGEAVTVTFDPGTNGTITAGDTVQVIARGTDAVEPTVAAYTGWQFTGWDTAFTNVTSNITVSAQYTIRSWTVNFSAGDHGAITDGDATQTIVHGGSATAPTIAAEYGWEFSEWSVEFDNVTSDLTVTAGYTPHLWSVIFMPGDHGSISAGETSQKVAHESSAVEPTVLADTDWFFTGWDRSFSFITNNVVITAQYDEGVVVTFAAGEHGSLVGDTEQFIQKGTSAVAPSVIPEDGWAFSGWDTGFDNVTVNLTVTAQYSILTYSVTFLPGDHGSISSGDASQTINHGESAVEPVVTAFAGYRFTGWNASFSNITSDRTITAQYEMIAYTVTFMEGDHGSITAGDAVQLVMHGENAVPPTIVPDSGWSFTGWSGSYTNITSDRILMPLYECVITIGTGTSTDQYLPVDTHYNYSYSQTIYLSTEIGTAGTIKELKYYYAGGSGIPNSCNWTVYMGHTSQTSFHGYEWYGYPMCDNWVPVTSMPQVYSNSFTAPPGGGWITLDITDFNYNGTDNLVIAIDENQPYSDLSTDDFYCSSVSGTRSVIYKGSSNINPVSTPSIWSYTYAYIPNIQMTFGTGAPAGNLYSVVFDEGSFGSISSGSAAQTVVEGESAVAPTISAYSGYCFDSWDADFDNVTSNLVVTAQYRAGADYSESFENYWLGLWEKVPGYDFDWDMYYGATPTSGTGPTSGASGPHYIYTEASGGNSPDKTAAVQAGFDLTGVTDPALLFNYHMYGSTMGVLNVDIYDGIWHNSAWFKSGNQGDVWQSAMVDLSPYSGQKITIRLRGVTGSGVTSDMAVDYIRLGTVVKYTVTFDDGDHGTITGGDAVQHVCSGEDAVAPAITSDSGWNFVGWDVSYTDVSANITVTAQYQPNHTVIFDAAGHGTITSGNAVQSVTDGENATAPTLVANSGWHFTGWDCLFYNVISNMTVTAQYLPIFTVTFNAGVHGSIVSADAIQSIISGNDASAPKVVPEVGWAMTGWDAVFTNVTGNLSITALYQSIQGGDGSLSNPYQIWTGADLSAVDADLSAAYILMTDIDLSGCSYNRAVIASENIYLNLSQTIMDGEAAPFTGLFDGNGHKISGLNCISSEKITGLFGRIGDGGCVRNLLMENCQINADQVSGSSCGGVMAGCNDGIIIDCTVTNSAVVMGSGNSAAAGGIVGLNRFGLVKDCRFHGDITTLNGFYSDKLAGGIAGCNCGGMIDCSSSGSVSSSSSSTVNSYAGGVVGYNKADFSDCHSSCSVYARSYSGGLVGRNVAKISNCYATGPVSGYSNVGGLAGEIDSYVFYGLEYCYATGDVSGSGSGVGNIGGLIGYMAYGNIRRCTAAGNVSNGDDIGGLIGQNGSSYGDGSLSLCSASGNVSQGVNLGGLIGKLEGYDDYLGNCYASGSVDGGSSYSWCGGLVGYNNHASIYYCYAVGAISGGNPDTLGGLIGFNFSGSVNNCFWNTTTSGVGSSDGGTGKSTSQMMQESTYTDSGWEVDADYTSGETDSRFEYWYMSADGISYPILDWQYRVQDLDPDGSGQEPYPVYTVADLVDINNHPDACYVLMADIDFAGHNYSRAPVSPDTSTAAGYQGTAFTGRIDGNGFVIRNLSVNGGSNEYIGLIGCNESGVLNNIRLLNCSFSGANYVGLSGYAVSAYHNRIVLEDCNFNGYDYIGGVAGLAVHDVQYTIGYTYEAYVKGSVTGHDYVGGLFGKVDHKMRNCGYVGTVSGSSYVGGLTGYSADDMNYCYAAATVSGSTGRGAITGYKLSGNIQSCLYDSTLCNLSSYGTGHATAEMKTLSTYAETGFSCVGEPYDTLPGGGIIYGFLWYINGDSYPVFIDALNYSVTFDAGEYGLIVNGEDEQTVLFGLPAVYPDIVVDHDWLFAGWNADANCVTGNLTVTAMYARYTEGDGSADNPYQVTTREQLAAIGNNLDACYIVMNDIDFAGISFCESPIAPESNPLMFTGTIDGNGYTIRNLNVNTAVYESGSDSVNGFDGSYDNYVGLIGKIDEGGCVFDLTLENVYLVGYQYVGGLAGWNKGGSVENCHVSGTVLGESYSFYTGGLIGCHGDGEEYVVNANTIRNCSADVTMDLDYGYRTGGLVGACLGSIENCTSSGSLSGGYFSSGGLAGYCSGTILNSRSSCAVNSSIDSDLRYSGGCGGLVGYGLTISSCYATGNVSCDGKGAVGGLAGNAGNVVNCYSTGSVYSREGTVGGLVGSLASKAQECYSTSAVSGGQDSVSLGGLIGSASFGPVIDCYASGSVTAGSSSENVGGLVGYTVNAVSISRCYSVCEVTPGIYTDVCGGFGGNLSDTTTLSASFWDVDVTGITVAYITGNTYDGYVAHYGSAGSVEDKSTALLKTQSTFTGAGWNFASIWAIDSSFNNGYPVLLASLPDAPVVTTIGATDISTTSAIMNGEADANGSETTVWFEYGSTSGYGYTVAATPSSVDEPYGVSVQCSVTGLQPGTTYHYRLKAINSAGTSYGSDMTFSTVATQNISDFTPADGSVFYVGDSINLSATASSGLSVSFSSAGDSIVSWIDSDTVMFTEAGTVQMIASQAGNSSYEPAANVTNTWTVIRLRTVRTSVGDNGSASVDSEFTIQDGGSTSIVYRAADWYRIESLVIGGVAVPEAVGEAVYTQVLIQVSSDISNEVVFVEESADEEVVSDVPVSWARNYFATESEAKESPDLLRDYLLNVDPRVAHSIEMKIIACSIDGDTLQVSVELADNGTVLNTTINGEIVLFAAGELGEAYHELTSSAIGNAQFNAEGRCNVTFNGLSDSFRYFRAIIKPLD